MFWIVLLVVVTAAAGQPRSAYFPVEEHPLDNPDDIYHPRDFIKPGFPPYQYWKKSVPAASHVHHIITTTLKNARAGITGRMLKAKANEVIHVADAVLAAWGGEIDWAKIRDVISKVSSNLSSVGNLNADLALWDGLRYLFEKTTEEGNIFTVVAAVKLVAQAIIQDIPDMTTTYRYIPIPYPVESTI